MSHTLRILLLAGCAALAHAQFVPSPGSPFPTGPGPVSIISADFNGDGIPDLAIADSLNNTATILLGNGSGGFTVGTPVTLGWMPASLAVWNATGFAAANQIGNSVSLFQNNGSGSFTAVAGSPFPAGSAPAFVVAADFNADAVTDLAVADAGASAVTLLLGVAGGGFAPAPASPLAVGNKPVAIAVADFNGDYIPDLAVVNQADNSVTVLLGDGQGGFTPAPGSPVPVGGSPAAIAAGDFNQDGKYDLAVANSADNTVTVLLGDGSGKFTAASGSPYPAGKTPVAIVADDLNADRELDLVTANSGDNSLTVLLAAGPNGFASAPYSPIPVGAKPAALVIADFNADGKPDIAAANSGGQTVTVLLNDYLNGVPAPQMLSAASGSPTVSAGEIVSIYGAGFAASPQTAATLPLPLHLGGVSAEFVITNILGFPITQAAMPLFYVSPTQINALLPADIAFPSCAGGSGSVYYAAVQLDTPSGGQSAPVAATPAPAPALFTANETGSGVAAAQFVTNLPDGTQTMIDVASCPGGAGTCVPVPLDVTAGDSALVLWGTGISEYSTFPQGLTVTAGSLPLQVTYAGASAQYAGLDQINVALPAGLAGSGVLTIAVTLTGATPGVGIDCPFHVASNAVTVQIR